MSPRPPGDRFRVGGISFTRSSPKVQPLLGNKHLAIPRRMQTRGTGDPASLPCPPRAVNSPSGVPGVEAVVGDAVPAMKGVVPSRAIRLADSRRLPTDYPPFQCGGVRHGPTARMADRAALVELTWFLAVIRVIRTLLVGHRPRRHDHPVAGEAREERLRTHHAGDGRGDSGVGRGATDEQRDGRRSGAARRDGCLQMHGSRMGVPAVAQGGGPRGDGAQGRTWLALACGGSLRPT